MGSILKKIVTAFGWLVGAIMVYIAISIDYEVVMRYFLRRSTGWVVEFSEYALVAAVFLGAAWVQLKGRHIKIDILLNYLPSEIQRKLNMITSVIAAIVFSLLFWYSGMFTWDCFRSKLQLMEASIFVPAWAVFVVMPLGSLLITYQFARTAWLYALRRKVPED